MKTFLLLMVLSGTPAQPPKAAKPAPDAGVVVAREPCGDSTCVAPEKCVTYSGMRQGVTHSGCYIQCAGGVKCPAGMECTMMYDGPGHVCVKK